MKQDKIKNGFPLLYEILKLIDNNQPTTYVLQTQHRVNKVFPDYRDLKLTSNQQWDKKGCL